MSFEQYRECAAKVLGRAQLWRILLTLALIFTSYLMASTAMFLLSFDPDRIEEILSAPGQSPPYVTLVLLGAFPIALFLSMVFIWLIGPRGPVLSLHRQSVLKPFLFGCLVVAILFGITALFPGDGGLLPGLERPVWLRWLIPALTLLAVQTLAEEVVFRGFLQSRLAARYRSPLIWWILPNVAFGCLHWFSFAEFGGNAPLAVAVVILMGLLFGDMTARTGSIALSWGVHFANNCFSVLYISIPGPLSGFARHVYDIRPEDPDSMQPLLIGNLIAVAGVYLLYLGWITLGRNRRDTFAFLR